MEEVKKILMEHGACDEGVKWAEANCKTMQEVWENAKPEWLIWLATRKGVLAEKDLHRFSCWSVRQIWHLLTDERSRNAVIVKERWIEGEATDEELSAADAAATASASDARASAATSAAAWAATSAAAAAARGAAAAARDAAAAAAWDAAWAADEAAAAAWASADRAAQATHIRSTYKPNFGGV